MARVLIVDDEPGMRQTLGTFLENDGHTVHVAGDVKAAMVVLETSDIDVVVSDIIMPGETGVQLLARISEREDGISVILLTGEPTVDTASEAVREGAFDYLSKPLSKATLLTTVQRAAAAKSLRDENVRLQEENERYRTNLEGLVESRTEELEKRTTELATTLRESIGLIAHALEIRDPYTAGHQRRVADLALALAKALGMSETDAEGCHVAASVHDVGKIGTPAEILTKPSRLTEIEFALVKEHSNAGYQILKDVTFPWPIAEIVLQHHERLDGSGYPKGLHGDAIRPEARIIAVADVVEAMSSHRPYRAALGMDAALAEIDRGRGSAYDADVADACLRLIRDDGYRLSE